MNQTVLVIAAHPDDEVLGCGGTIAKHAAAGDNVHILLMAEGITSRDRIRDVTIRENELSSLAETAQKAGRFLGAGSVDFLSFPDNRMDSLPLLDIIKAVEGKMEQIRPDLVYTHHGGDLNVDHLVTHRAVVTACRPWPEQTVRALLFFEVPSSTDWQAGNAAEKFYPNWFVDLSPSINGTTFLDKKLQALEMYDSEMRDFPHARSIKAVKCAAVTRGTGVGLKAAEGFMVGRSVV